MATLNNISAAQYDIKYYRNDELDLNITVTDSDGDAVDLSGKTLVMQIKAKKTDSTSLYELTVGDGITVSGASNNIVTFSGTYDLSEKAYFYDMENQTDNKTIMEGKFIVTGDVTREAL